MFQQRPAGTSDFPASKPVPRSEASEEATTLREKEELLSAIKDKEAELENKIAKHALKQQKQQELPFASSPTDAATTTPAAAEEASAEEREEAKGRGFMGIGGLKAAVDEAYADIQPTTEEEKRASVLKQAEPNPYSQYEQVVWFCVSGSIGTLLSYLLFEALLFLDPFAWHKGTLCWALSYLISISWQHALHRGLLMGDYGNYWLNLLKSYMVYVPAVLFSTSLYYLLDERLHVTIESKWIIVTLATGLLTLFSVRHAFVPPVVSTKDMKQVLKEKKHS
ncbi:hypothetical protein QOT17_001142 [Balamuthia mandrillaris]